MMISDPETEELNDDLDGDIGAAFDAALEADDDVGGQVSEAAEKTADPVSDTTRTADADKSDRQPKGDDATKEPVSTNEELALAPKSLSVGMKSKWEKLDPEVKKEFIKRENDFHNGLTEYRDGHSFAKEVMRVAQPYLPIIRAEGGNVISAVDSLLNTAYKMRQDPTSTIVELAHQYGVDLAGLSERVRVPQQDPQYAQLTNKISQLEGYIQSGIRGQQQTQEQWAAGEIEKFANDPSKIYFSNVADDMTALIQTGRAHGLEDAYDKACNMNPGIRSALLAKQQSEAENKRVNDARQKAQQAKRASFDVKGSEASAPVKRDMSLDESLSHAWDKVSGL